MRWYYALAVLALILVAFLNFYTFDRELLLQPSDLDFDSNGSIAPLGAYVQGVNGIIFDGTNYLFYHAPTSDSPADVVYSISINDLDVQKGLIKVYEFISGTYPIINGGTYYRNSEGAVITPLQFSQQANVVFTYQRLPGNVLSLRYLETLNGYTNEKEFYFEIVGKTLVVRANAINSSSNYLNNYAGFTLGQIGNVTSARYLHVPYMKTTPISVVNNNYFESNYIDWTRSNSNDNPQQNYPGLSDNKYSNTFSSKYIPGQNNIYNSLSETAYVTISNDIYDTFMNINRQKTQYRDDLSRRVVLEINSINDQQYFDNSSRLGRYYPNANYFFDTFTDYGLKDLFFVLHSSMALNNQGLTLPQICPPSTWYGSQQDLITLRDNALSNGALFAPVHDDRADFFQNSPYYQNYCDSDRNPTSYSEDFPIALEPNGKCKLSGWYVSGFSPAGYFYQIATDKMMNYAIPEMACLNSYIESNAHYLDVSAKIGLGELLDYSELNNNSRTLAQGFQEEIELNNYIRDQIGGPLTAEGGEHVLQTIDSYLAGNVESYNREIYLGEDAPVIPDFELKVFNKLSTGKGMGSMDRWIRKTGPSYSSPVIFSDFVSNKSDKYRASTVAFGHTAFIDDIFLWTPGSQMTPKEFINYGVKEYYLLSKLQELYLSSNVQSISYYRNGNFMNLGNTLLSFSSQNEQNNYFENQTKLKINYDNGLEVYVNRDLNQVWQVNISNQVYYLPPQSWAAHHSESKTLAYSALVDSNGDSSIIGHRVDYVHTPDYIMMNPRGVPTSFNNPYTLEYNTTYLTVIKPNGWKLTENNLGEFLVSSTNYCGDNYCSIVVGETCNSCSSDCGSCPPSQSTTSGSGSGGSGGSVGSGGSSGSIIGGSGSFSSTGSGGSSGGNNEIIESNESQETPLGSTSEESNDRILRPVLYIVIIGMIAGIILTILRIFKMVRRENNFKKIADYNSTQQDITY